MARKASIKAQPAAKRPGYNKTAGKKKGSPMNSLLELLEEGAAESREPLNTEKDVKRSIENFILYNKLAAEELGRGNSDPVELKLASDEMEKIDTAFETMKKDSPDAYARYSDKWEEVRADSKTAQAVGKEEHYAGYSDLLEKNAKDSADFINSVIDFQSSRMGKKSGADADAVNESLRLLANAVAGTHAEMYLNQQLNKVNKARGLKAGDPDFLRFDDLREAEEEGMREEQMSEQEKMLESGMVPV